MYCLTKLLASDFFSQVFKKFKRLADFEIVMLVKIEQVGIVTY